MSRRNHKRKPKEFEETGPNSPQAMLERAQLSWVAARRKLEEVLDDDSVWADDGPDVREAVLRAAEMLDMAPGEVAGVLEVVRRCSAVIGTRGAVDRLTAHVRRNGGIES